MPRFILRPTEEGWMLIILDWTNGPTDAYLDDGAAPVPADMDDARWAKARAMARAYGYRLPHRSKFRRDGAEYTA